MRIQLGGTRKGRVSTRRLKPQFAQRLGGVNSICVPLRSSQHRCSASMRFSYVACSNVFPKPLERFALLKQRRRYSNVIARLECTSAVLHGKLASTCVTLDEDPNRGRIKQDDAKLNSAARDSGGNGVELLHPASPRSKANKTTQQHLSVDDKVKARSLYRAILREASYLPDSQARKYASQHAETRFKTNSIKAWKRRNDDGRSEWLRSKHKEARKHISELRRANEGEVKPLLKVLCYAYGRDGKRRRELLKPLLSKDEHDAHASPSEAGNEQDDGEDDASSKKSSTTNASGAAREGKDSHSLPQLTPQLRALVLSQIQAGNFASGRRSPRSLKPSIPELNAWLRPMPAVRVKNMTKVWYAKTLNEVQAPLPTKEWQRLRQLATGEITFDGPTPRRSLAKSDGRTPQHDTALELTLIGKPDTKVFGNYHARELTTRSMRRGWAQVFRQCPVMDWDGERQQWDVRWGKHALYKGQSAPELTSTSIMPGRSSVEEVKVGQRRSPCG